MAYSADSFVADEQPTTAKWNKLWSNDAAFNDGSGFADGIVLPKHLITGAGSSWVLQDYVPTWTNFTVSSSTVVARYLEAGKWVSGYITVTLGGGNAPSGAVSFTLPVNSRITSVGFPIGRGSINDGGAAVLPFDVVIKDADEANCYAINSSGTYATDNNMSGSVPISWANGDIFMVTFGYEKA